MDSPQRTHVVYRDVDTNRADLGAEIVEIIADFEGTDPEDLDPIRKCIGDILEPLSLTPPSPDAQLMISFSYEGYRISLDQNGQALLVLVEG